jgi:hypothetical protein
MPRYLVRKIYKHTVEVEVEAENESEAKDRAQEMDGDRNHDDYLYDCEVIKKLEG